jgi:hypothetical protein
MQQQTAKMCLAAEFCNSIALQSRKSLDTETAACLDNGFYCCCDGVVALSATCIQRVIFQPLLMDCLDLSDIPASYLDYAMCIRYDMNNIGSKRLCTFSAALAISDLHHAAHLVSCNRS